MIRIAPIAICAAMVFASIWSAPVWAQTGRIAIGYEPYGMSPFPLQSIGYRVSYQPWETAELEASYVSADTRLLMVDAKYEEVSLRYKYFLTGTVHAGLGLGQRMFHLDYDVVLADESTESISETAKALIGNVAFGFETTFWGFLTVGSDFVTFSQAIQWQERDNQFPDNADASEEDPRELPFVQKALGNNVHFLRTYIKVGW